MPATPTIGIANYCCIPCFLVLYILPVLVFLLVFPIVGACCAQLKGFTLGCRELVLVRPNVKSFS